MDDNARFYRLESFTRTVPLYQRIIDFDPRIPPPTNIIIAAQHTSVGVTTATIKWLSPNDPNIDRYEIWTKRTDSPGNTLLISTKDSPARVSITAASGTIVIAYIRTVLKNNLSIPLTACPTVIFKIP